MFVASYITDLALEDLRDSVRDVEYGALTLCDIAHGHVVCLSINPNDALAKAIEILTDEIADGFEVEPDMLRDNMMTEVLAKGMIANLVEITTEVLVTFVFDDSEGDVMTVQAGIAINQFEPV